MFLSCVNSEVGILLAGAGQSKLPLLTTQLDAGDKEGVKNTTGAFSVAELASDQVLPLPGSPRLTAIQHSVQ